jgi:hypothetical protein
VKICHHAIIWRQSLVYGVEEEEDEPASKKTRASGMHLRSVHIVGVNWICQSHAPAPVPRFSRPGGSVMILGNLQAESIT